MTETPTKLVELTCSLVGYGQSGDRIEIDEDAADRLISQEFALEIVEADVDSPDNPDGAGVQTYIVDAPAPIHLDDLSQISPTDASVESPDVTPIDAGPVASTEPDTSTSGADTAVEVKSSPAKKTAKSTSRSRAQ